MEGKSRGTSLKYTELKFNIEDVCFSVHYTHRFGTKDGIPADREERVPAPEDPKNINSLHTHKFCELFFFWKDEIDIFFEDRTLRLSKNDVILVSPNVLHTASTKRAGEAMCIDFSFGKNSLYRRGGLYDLLLKLTDMPYLHLVNFRPYFNHVNTFYEHLDRGNVLMVMRYFYDIILDLLMSSSSMPHVAPEDMLHDTEIMRSRLIDSLISRYYSENVSLEFMAEHLNLSVRQTSRIIKAYTGHSLGELLLAKRMKAASDCLREDKLSVSEISARVGYNSLACFYRAFKKHFGTLPSEYRAELLKSKKVTEDIQ